MPRKCDKHSLGNASPPHPLFFPSETLRLNLLLNIASQLAAHANYLQLFAKQNIKAAEGKS